MRTVPVFAGLAFAAVVFAACSGQSSGDKSQPLTSSSPGTYPFSVSFDTSPCFDRPWTRLLADRWAVRDAVTGSVIARDGRGYQSRCGFYIQYRLTAGDFAQYSQVYIYDPKQQLVGLNQSNAGEAKIFVKGHGGPFKLTKNVVVNGPSLTDCHVLPAVCQGLGSISSPAPPVTGSYETYTNQRFGYTTLWPSSFTAQPPPEDGDGQEWTYNDHTTTLTVYGENNINQYSPRADLRVISRGVHVTYSNISDNVVTVSGYKGPNTIIYERDVLGAGSIDTLLWRYPVRERSIWQPANTKTALTFRPGDTSASH